MLTIDIHEFTQNYYYDDVVYAENYWGIEKPIDFQCPVNVSFLSDS